MQNDLLEKLQLLVEADKRLHKTAASTKGMEENLRFWLEHVKKRLERDRLYAEADTLAAEKDEQEKQLVSLARSINQDVTDDVLSFAICVT